ncbi:MAG: hypothetical protein IIX48_05055 [Lachnospiraceae bacterium]|nr:hypothetical protein [Lachnospiraceae bacterium]
MRNSIKVKFSAPLNEVDSETQTFGCRQNNPDICKWNGVEGVCAFANADCVCKQPSRAWKKQYQALKEQECN